jgi:protocatechuate 3,4-dioxygenase beta subunit
MRRAIAVALVLAAGCGGSSQPVERAAKTCAPTPGVYEGVEPAPAGTPSDVRLGPGWELKATKRNLAGARVGKPLVVSGRVRGEDCKGLAGATIYVHQTNGAGRYGPVVDGRDKCCYLQAAVRTGEDGHFRLAAVIPKAYRGGGPPHIHLTAGHPDTEGLLTEVQFGTATGPDTIAVPTSELRDGALELDIVLRRS